MLSVKAKHKIIIGVTAFLLIVGVGFVYSQGASFQGALTVKEDHDGDGMRNAWEKLYGLDPAVNDAKNDLDGDGLLNYEEYLKKTAPNDSDSDNDALIDGDEVNIYKTRPLDSDSDDDGLSDGEEVYEVFGNLTDPLDSDSDDDGLSDGEEVNTYKTLPLDSDSDDDGLSDGDEVNVYLTDPNDFDSDGGSLMDGDEITSGKNPLDASDDNAVPSLISEVLGVQVNAMYGEVGASIEGGGRYAGTSGSPASICELLGYDASLTGEAVGYWWYESGGPGFCPTDLNYDLTCSSYPTDTYYDGNSYGAPWSANGYAITSTTTLSTFTDPEGTTWDSGFNPGWTLAVECGRYE